MAFRPLIVASLCWLALPLPAGATPSSDKLNGLLNNSPFGTGRGNAAAGTGTNDPLEFRSVLEENGKRCYLIFDASTRRSTWVELNDPVNGFSVKGYDAAHDTVTVEFHGKSMSLAIKRAAPVAQAAVVPTGVGPATQAIPGMPSPLDQQRLQQVQEEIRRRRALRQQPPPPGSMPGMPPGPQPMPVIPGDGQSGPQPMPSNPANAQPGPQVLPVPAKP